MSNSASTGIDLNRLQRNEVIQSDKTEPSMNFDCKGIPKCQYISSMGIDDVQSQQSSKEMEMLHSTTNNLNSETADDDGFLNKKNDFGERNIVDHLQPSSEVQQMPEIDQDPEKISNSVASLVHEDVQIVERSYSVHLKPVTEAEAFKIDNPSPVSKAKYRSIDLNDSLYGSDVDTSSSSESSYSSDSSSSSTSTESDEMENAGKAQQKNSTKPKTKSCIPKTKGELTLEDLPPIQDLNITLPEEEPIEMIGTIYKIVDQLVLVQAQRGTRPLDIDSVLFLEERQPLGQVFDVLGPVAQPYYAVRFNSVEDISNRKITTGLSVFSAPGRKEVTTYVFTEELRKQKGSDASWKDNNEPPVQCLDFSDDEDERRTRQKLKAKSHGQSDVPDSVCKAKAPNTSTRGTSRGRVVHRHNAPHRLIRPGCLPAPLQYSYPSTKQMGMFPAPPPPVFGAPPPMFGCPSMNFPVGFSGSTWMGTSPRNSAFPFSASSFHPQNLPLQPFMTMSPRPPIPPPNFFMPPPPPPPTVLPQPQFSGCPQNGFHQSPTVQQPFQQNLFRFTNP